MFNIDENDQVNNFLNSQRLVIIGENLYFLVETSESFQKSLEVLGTEHLLACT